MNTLARWGKFNAVGVVGTTVQLGVLAVLNRSAQGHYLAASAAALEITLLHNFAWHVCYTWRDRQGGIPLLMPLVRFHLTNGMVSMAGNFACLPVLVVSAHLPVLLANLITILICSVANFLMSDRWIFTEAVSRSL